MRILFLTSIAALLLATGAVHARDEYSLPPSKGRFIEDGKLFDAKANFDCTRLPKFYLGGHFSQEHTTKDTTLNFEVGFSSNRERSLPGEEIVIRYNRNTGKLWINGNRCKWSE